MMVKIPQKDFHKVVSFFAHTDLWVNPVGFLALSISVNAWCIKKKDDHDAHVKNECYMYV